MDRPHFRSLLAERHLNMGGYVDHANAIQMGRLLGPTALIFVKISRCEAQQHRNVTEAKNFKGEVVRTSHAIAEMHIRGSLQTVDLATGRIFSASPIEEDAVLENQATQGQPEFPSRDALRDAAIDRAAFSASTMFVQWNEQKQLYFFNDKECNLNVAFTLLKANDFDGTVRQSEQNLAACPTWPKVKDSNMAHAYYNVGLAYLLVNDTTKAMSYLTESAKLKGGQIVSDTMLQVQKSAQLDAEMRQVAEKTDAFEQSQADMKAQAQAEAQAQAAAAASAAAAGNSNGPADSVEERLRKLDSLYKKGLLTRPEYDAKRAEILKGI